MNAEKINIRSTFLPDEGCVMVRCDLSQIEHRMCMMYCGTPRTVDLANKKPTEYDAHTENAKLIFRKQEINKQERYLGKKCVHGAERMMGGYRMSESISKDTKGELYVHPRQCDQLLDAFYAAMPEIKGIYFPWVERQVRSVGVLTTSWGRRLLLKGRRIDESLYKEAYSYYLQAEAADWTNQYLFIPTYHYMIGRYGKAPNGQVHDEVIACVPVEDAWELAMFMQKAAQQTREIPKGGGNWLTVPAEVSIGRSWGDKEAIEFKEVPGRDVFYQQLKEKGF